MIKNGDSCVQEQTKLHNGSIVHFKCNTIVVTQNMKGIVWFESARPVTMTINSDIKLAFDCSGDKKLKL